MDITIVADESADDQDDHSLGFFLTDFFTVDRYKSFFHHFAPGNKLLLHELCNILIIMCKNVDLSQSTGAVLTELVFSYI